MTKPDFDENIDRVGTHCSKWDDMHAIYDVSPAQGGLAMWVADMDFRPPAVVQHAVERLARHGIYGYGGANPAYQESIRWWLANRHGWDIDTNWLLTSSGLVNGVGLALDAYSQEGDGVIVMSPVYHAFARVIRASKRELVEFPLAIEDGQYRLDWPAWQQMLTGREKILLLCSPHNPGGRVWTEAELREIADFCVEHDLILVSDDIHCDLVFPGHKHRMMAQVAPDIQDRLVTMTAATKTFNIAGAHVGHAIIADENLRARYKAAVMSQGVSPNLFGPHMVTAAYSPEGAAWLDALMLYLDGNRRLFDDGVNAIPGLRSMPLESTYLSWVDFSDTGMSPAEFTARVEKTARIAANHGDSFGTGGENFLRFNIGTPRARVAEAVQRLQDAFRDLQ